MQVVSCLDIYARVGGNEPLVVSGLHTFVDDDKGLSIRLEGVIGRPILCGISIKKDFPASKLSCSYGSSWFQILFYKLRFS